MGFCVSLLYNQGLPSYYFPSRSYAWFFSFRVFISVYLLQAWAYLLFFVIFFPYGLAGVLVVHACFFLVLLFDLRFVMSFETERGLREKDEKKEGRRFVVLKTSSSYL